MLLGIEHVPNLRFAAWVPTEAWFAAMDAFALEMFLGVMRLEHEFERELPELVDLGGEG